MRALYLNALICLLGHLAAMQGAIFIKIVRSIYIVLVKEIVYNIKIMKHIKNIEEDGKYEYRIRKKIKLSN